MLLFFLDVLFMPDAGYHAEELTVTVRVDNHGRVNSSDVYKKYVELVKRSKLVGYVPRDGQRFGIKTGSAEEWARLFWCVTKQESNFFAFNRTGRNVGLNQYSVGDENTGGMTRNKQDLLDPNKSMQALVNDAEISIRRDGSISGKSHKWLGLAGHFECIRKPKQVLKHFAQIKNNVQID